MCFGWEISCTGGLEGLPLWVKGADWAPVRVYKESDHEVVTVGEIRPRDLPFLMVYRPYRMSYILSAKGLVDPKEPARSA